MNTLCSTPKEEVKTVELLLITADRGLCGSFNTNLLVAAEKFIKAKNAEGIEVSLINAGRKATRLLQAAAR